MEQTLSSRSSEGEARLNQLKQEVTRLKFDTPEGKIPDIKFDLNTGEDLRNNPEKMLKAQKRMLLAKAESAMGDALRHREDKHGGIERNGVLLLEEKIGEDGNITSESLQARLDVFRKHVSVRVNEAREAGVMVPKFDTQTGEEIPQDSLRAFMEAEEEVRAVYSPRIANIARALGKGKIDAVEAYKQYKQMKNLKCF